jgi:hypothetical protein
MRLIKNRIFLVLTGLFCITAAAQTSVETPAPATLVFNNTYAFDYKHNSLSGLGADFLRGVTANSQFVLFGEEHMDYEVPRFAAALFSMLHNAHDFSILVVEQDPVAMEDALAPDRRGSAEKMALWANTYPSLFEFDSDQDLEFIAMVSGLVSGPNAIWGIEQSTGVARYLDELAKLAPNEPARDAARQLLAEVWQADPGPTYSVNFLADLNSPAKLDALAQQFDADPSSRAGSLLLGLTTSAEIFGYYTRAVQGEYVGLYNNTVREAWMKQQFRSYYLAVAADGSMPKAMFKFGSNHMVHGRNLTQAFPTGNLAHELAIMNGADAYGLMVLPFGPDYVDYATGLPAALRPLLPVSAPLEPTLVDLRALRRFQKLFHQQLEPVHKQEMLTYLHGYDAIVLLPNSKPATYTLGGRRR